MMTIFDRVKQLLALPMSDTTLRGKLQVLVAESDASEERTRLEKLLSFPMSEGSLRVKLSMLVASEASNETDQPIMLNEETPVIEEADETEESEEAEEADETEEVKAED